MVALNIQCILAKLQAECPEKETQEKEIQGGMDNHGPQCEYLPFMTVDWRKAPHRTLV